VQPDMMCCAKGITSAYFPVGACLLSGKIAEVFESSDEAGAIFHGYTYSAHPVGAAAVIACLSETLRLDTKTNAAARGTQLYEGMKALQDKYDLIGDVRGGHGPMTGVELVSDRAAKTPLDAATIGRIHKAAYEAGTMTRIGGNNILMSPPLIITEDEVNTIIASMEAGLKAA